MSTEHTISPDHAADLYEAGVICEEVNPTAGPWTYVTSQDVGSRQWNSDHRMVLRDEDGAYWGLSYTLGLTEEQPNELPWDDSDELLPLRRLYPRQTTYTTYSTKPPVNTEERPEDAARRLAGELLTTQAALIEATRLITEMLKEFDTMKYLGWVPATVVEQWRTRALALSIIATGNDV